VTSLSRNSPDKLSRHASAAFQDHRITKSGSDRWVIKGPHGGQFWTEIVSLEGAKLFVHGDIDCVLFAYAGKHYGPEQKVRWIGNSSLDYAREKASIGTGHEVANDIDTDVAIWELYELLRDGAEYEDPSVLKNRDEIEDGISALKYGEHVDVVMHQLYQAGVDPEWIGSLGRVVSSRVAYAHAAVKRLAELLEEEKQKSGDKPVVLPSLDEVVATQPMAEVRPEVAAHFRWVRSDELKERGDDDGGQGVDGEGGGDSEGQATRTEEPST